MQNKIAKALKEAMKAKEATRLSTLRLVSAAIKDREIAMRVREDQDGVGDAEVLSILGKMVKQRQDSAKIYEEGGRLELAEREREEIKIIEEFLPRKLSDEEVRTAIGKAIKSTGAESLRDMGKVMSTLKDEFAGQIDFGQVGGMVKTALSGPA